MINEKRMETKPILTQLEIQLDAARQWAEIAQKKPRKADRIFHGQYWDGRAAGLAVAIKIIKDAKKT